MKQNQLILRSKRISIHNLYDAYAGMLLGYIFEVVKDRQIAEDYLVKTFSRVAENFNQTNWTEINAWSKLLHTAKNELAAFYKVAEAGETPVGTLPNLYLDRMTEEQKLIFCNIYYSKKTTTQIAKEVNKPEVEVKQSLKEAFAVIRRSNGR